MARPTCHRKLEDIRIVFRQQIGEEASMRLFYISILFILAFVVIANSSSPGYHLVKKIPLSAAAGGGEYFDYITFDDSARRVYVSHGTEFQVLDADTNKVVGTITGLKRCHGIAIVDSM